MRSGLFKPNCALVLIDFFIRHGIIAPDTEPGEKEGHSHHRENAHYFADYMKIVTRLHGRFDYERWVN